MNNILVSIVIPAFNEEANIGQVLKDVHEIMNKTQYYHEVIVVDDGSKDRTSLVSRDNDAIVVCHPRNLGKGEALKTGFMKARGDIIVMMDSDCSHKPEDIPKLLSVIIDENVDVVIGSRFLDSSSKQSTSRLHLLGNKMISAIILFVTGRYLSDTQTGFRAFRRSLLNGIAVNTSRFEVESELTIRMLRNGFKVKEVPISCLKRKSGESNIRALNDGFKILKTIIKSAFGY